MEKQPQFPFAPKDFARCLNATCPRSQNCLRRTAALQDTDEHLFLKVVNPLRYPKEGEECELFRSTDKVRMAWGVTHLLDNVPYKELIPFAESIHSDRLLRENNEKMRQEFTANVSHELKTPLTSISGYAELIETGIAQPKDIPDFARKIHVEASRMIQLVNDILQLSNLDNVSEAGTPLTMETVDLLEVARECVERQKVNAKRSFISLTYLGESAPVLGSRSLLDELCQNLCDNAIRYNRPGGKVQIITACTRDGHCSLTVKDNGIGIPKEAQSSVFERFYRVDKSRSKATGGTGLGLAIVKHIARIHNARIKLESEIGEGTTITVLFETAH